jgi:hypothetical protein
VYTLNEKGVMSFDARKARAFVYFWGRYYRYRVKVLGSRKDIDYFAELNPGGNLTAQNLTRLLRWKDPHHLTDKILSGPNKGKKNKMVEAALDSLKVLNMFRRDSISENETLTALANVFESGVVFRVFMLHVAKPHVFPIADQHIFRAYGVHKGVNAGDSWATYQGYRSYFSEIALSMEVTESLARIRDLKRIDNALMTFGRFLKEYSSQAALHKSPANST